jgi:hypothetical protein
MSIATAAPDAERAEVGIIEFFHGTPEALAIGAVMGPEAFAPDPVNTLLDSGRAAGRGQRAGAIWVAASVVEATAIAVIRGQQEPVAAALAAIRMYRVRLIPFHRGPVAVLHVLREPVGATAIPRLVGEYWQPSGQWWLQELLTPSMRVLEQVAPASERDIYLKRWVHYHQDWERAAALAAPDVR